MYSNLSWDRSSRPKVFCKKGALRNFAKFTGNINFFITLLKKRLAQAFSCEFSYRASVERINNKVDSVQKNIENKKKKLNLRLHWRLFFVKPCSTLRLWVVSFFYFKFTTVYTFNRCFWWMFFSSIKEINRLIRKWMSKIY